MKKFFAAAIATLAVAAPAVAQDTAPKTGFRAEALAGWDRIEADGLDAEGLAYGGAIGYDFQAGGAVLGLEAEAMGSTGDKCFGAGTAIDPRGCIKSSRDLYAGVRVGGMVTPATMIYAKGGYTNTRIRGTVDTGTGPVLVASENGDGWRLGAGVEHSFGNRLYGKAEYRYTNYEGDASRHQALVGLGVRF